MPGNKEKTVIVAMSGGVDSSVAAFLLKKNGFRVLGVFMKFWSSDPNLENVCCSSESETRARLVAKKLGIPFYVLNFKKQFKEKVVDYFTKEQKSGFTPNPCVVCNKEIKFNLLFRKFPLSGADFMATGHYVKLKNNRIYIAKDKEKDQSYFLWKLNRKIIKKALFPVGDFNKKEIRAMAKKQGLAVWDLKESQDVCFKVNLGRKPGKIIDTQGNAVGRHKGLWFYTIGQRKGINLPGGPYYVLRKDVKNNFLIVTKKERDLFSKELKFKQVNWIFKKPDFPLKIRAKIRYHQKASPAVLHGNKVVFSRPQRAVTPGQSVVFYKNQELLGGGVII
jgi:tRNA-uridine 2-sulfurtransferase